MGLRTMQSQREVKGEELLEVINAIYHINEAMKVVMSYDDEAYEYLTKARESLIYYLISQVKDYE
ncbi:hypothetical protein MetMK1DRAFT_00009590 [Metallosphaera yellowstonensis MK1]|jgi:argonaute-like protein implicated in RNA metabolism and viral defense|uniref:Uncharacterized protein n=2 Tax=Sulfolobales TaxID=2281 RepID=H2C2I6_9CREN|nr:hypothetical protein MetMK1DRAFT_00009590 [Metallosphaera yellowstonensis MK1]